MSWEVEETPTPEGEVPDYRVFVTNGVESFHIDRASAQRLCELLNATVKVKK